MGNTKRDCDQNMVKIASIPGVSHYNVPASRKIVAYCPSNQGTEVVKAHKRTLTDAAGAACVDRCTYSL